MKRSAWRTAHFEAVYCSTVHDVDKYCIKNVATQNLTSRRLVQKDAVPFALEWAESAYQHAVHEFSQIVRSRHGKSIGEIERELACGVDVPTEFHHEDD